MKNKNEISVIDTHIHIRGYWDIERTLGVSQQIAKYSHLDACNVLALTAWDSDSVAQNVLCMACKALYPKTYAYGGFDYFYDGIDASEKGRLEHLKNLLEMGFDGIKLIETKPSSRKKIGIGLNDSSYSLCFSYLEKEQLPVIWHVADPEENWVESKCDPYAKELGWYYGDSTFLTKEEIYAETLEVLDSYPQLQVTFAHMFFLSGDVERAKKILDTYPNVKFDLTPGREMYYNFDENYEAWREFFLQYKDRLIFGTDNGWGDEPTPEEKIEEGCNNIEMLKEYFSSKEQVMLWDQTYVNGMNLPREVLECILSHNFRKICKNEGSKPIKIDKVIEYARKILVQIQSKEEIRLEVKEQLSELIELLSNQGKANG